MKSTSIRRRTFSVTAAALVACLACTFFAVTGTIRVKVRHELKQSLADQERSEEEIRAEATARVGKLVSAMVGTSGLNAAIGLAREISTVHDLRAKDELDRTLQEQLSSLAQAAGYDLVALRDDESQVLSAVLRTPTGLAPLASGTLSSQTGGVRNLRQRYYKSIVVPVEIGGVLQGEVELGTELKLPPPDTDSGSVLLFRDRVVASAMPEWVGGRMPGQLPLRQEELSPDREMRFAGNVWLPQVMDQGEIGGAYRLVRLQSLDRALDQVLGGLAWKFAAIGVVLLVLVIGLSVSISRSVSGPISLLVDKLNGISEDDPLPVLPVSSGTCEVDVLAAAINRASATIAAGRKHLEEAYDNTIATLTHVLDARDKYTAGHSHRVSEYSVAIAKKMACTRDEIETIAVGATLHDIGKIGIPDSVLQKPGRLTDEEFEVIKQHPEIGRRLLEKLAHCGRYLGVIELHHENFDGTGYPYGLRATEVPLLARIVHVADAYDAMTSDRAYRRRLPEERVRKILSECSGTQFDPFVVEAFLEVLEHEYSEEPEVAHA